KPVFGPRNLAGLEAGQHRVAVRHLRREPEARVQRRIHRRIGSDHFEVLEVYADLAELLLEHRVDRLRITRAERSIFERKSLPALLQHPIWAALPARLSEQASRSTCVVWVRDHALGGRLS